MQIYYILTIEKVWHATIAAVSDLNLESPKEIFLKFIAWHKAISFLEKSPSGPIKTKLFSPGFISLIKLFFFEFSQWAISSLSSFLFFIKSFKIKKDKLKKLKYQSINQWDSVGHMSLMGALEEKFKITLEMDDIIDFSEIGEFFDQPLRTYSSGMRARLGIAVASAVEPEILLIDEVLGVGDPQFREKSKERIISLVKSTSTVVLVSHSFGLMREICDRVAFVHEGKIHCIGDPKDTIRAYYELTGEK